MQPSPPDELKDRIQIIQMFVDIRHHIDFGILEAQQFLQMPYYGLL